jgi:hypothetical protein
MKVICIKKYRSTSLQYELTYGKVYDALPGCGLPGIDNSNWWIINDRGVKEYYSRSKFLKLDL